MDKVYFKKISLDKVLLFMLLYLSYLPLFTSLMDFELNIDNEVYILVTSMTLFFFPMYLMHKVFNVNHYEDIGHKMSRETTKVKFVSLVTIV